MKGLLSSAINTATAETISNEYNLLVNTGTDSLTNVTPDQFVVYGDDHALPIGGVISGYPADNLLDNHPKKVTEAPTSTVRYTLDIVGSSDWCVLGNTNARYARCRVLYDDENVLFDETKSLGGIDTYLELIQDSGQALYETEFSYDYYYEAHTVILDLDTGNANVPVISGIVQIGESFQFERDTQRGLREGLIDYSISKQLSNGAYYYKKRDVVRTFSGSLYLHRNREFYKFMHQIFREIGSAPIFWKITDLDNADWLVYARAQNMPSGTHAYATASTVNYTLTEVL